MDEIREQIATVIYNYPNKMEWDSSLVLAEQIIFKLPKPTVTIPCEKGTYIQGDSYGEDYMSHENCPHCNDGKVEREIVLSYIIDRTGYTRTLTLPDLLDPDVAGAYSLIEGMHELRIPNNKGTLIVKGENDGA